MLGRFWEFTKAHPWLIGGSVLGLVVLIWFMTRGGEKTAPTGVWAMTTDPAIVAAEAQKSIAQNQLNAAVNIANIEAGSQKNYLSMLQTVSTEQFSTALKIREREITGMENLANVEKATRVALGELTNVAARDEQKTAISLASMHEMTARLGIKSKETTARSVIESRERESKRRSLVDAAAIVAEGQRSAYFVGGWQWGNPLGNDAYQDLLKRFG